jgi:hypothetical protein
MAPTHMRGGTASSSIVPPSRSMPINVAEWAPSPDVWMGVSTTYCARTARCAWCNRTPTGANAVTAPASVGTYPTASIRLPTIMCGP